MTTRASRADLRTRVDRGRRAIEAHDFATAARMTRVVVDALGPAEDPDDARLLVRALTILACSRHEVGGDRSWPGLLARAADLAVDRDLPDLQVAVHGARGYCHLRSGDVDAAMAVFAEADPWLDDCPVEDRVRLLLNRGTAHLERGSLTAAGEDLERVEREALADGLHELAQKARHNRGFLAFLRGDLPTALERFSSPAVDPAHDPAVAAILSDPLAHMDRARVLLEVGLVDDADDLLADAITGMQRASRPQDEGEAHLARARGALIAGDLDAAVDQTVAATARFAERGNERWMRRAEFTQLAVMVERLQAATSSADPRDVTTPAALTADTSEAIGLADRIDGLLAAALVVGDVDIAVPARSMLAEAAMLAGDRERAVRALADADPGQEEAVSIRLRWFRARAALAATGGADVQSIVREGLQELSRAQARVGSVDLRTAMTIHGHELAELGVSDALAAGHPAEVHAAVERAHASSTRLTPVRADASERELGQLARLRRANDALWRLDRDARPDEAARLRREVTDLEQSLRQQEWHRIGSSGAEDVVDLPRLQDRLASSEAVAASYTAVGSDLSVVRIDGSTVEVVRLGPLDPVRARVERLRSDLQALVLPGVPESVRAVMRHSVVATLAALSETLLVPLDLEDRPLVVVPHGPLALVPWPLLDRRLGLATTTAPCLTGWVRRGSSPARDASSREVVAVAGPGLDRAADEVAAVAASWPRARTLVGRAATGNGVRRALDTADVVHLATHGTHQVSSPLFSSLRLDDGPIFAHELGTDAAARLVVLSACEVGSHTIRRGDEPLGMTAALLQAAVPTVLASVARVRDDVAHDLMIDVHQRLATGASPAAALGIALATAAGDGHLVPFTCVGVGLDAL